MASVADTIFHGGHIITMDEKAPIVEALAVKDGVIVNIGKMEDMIIGEGTAVIDLNNQTLMPGLIEPHTHAVIMARYKLMSEFINGSEDTTYATIKNKMNSKVKETISSGKSWCMFFGWDPELVSDLPILSADFLDVEFSKDISICVIGQSGHVLWANNKALQVSGIENDTESPPGGVIVKDDNGRLTGQMLEPPATRLVMYGVIDTSPTADEISRSIEYHWKQYAKSGFTTVTDLLFTESNLINEALVNQSKKPDCPIRVALYPPRKAAGGQSATCRIVPQILNEKTGVTVKLPDDEMLWVQGYKIIADGSPHCGTMATEEPYLHTSLTEILGFPPYPNTGRENYSYDEIHKMIQHSERQVAVHAHGDKAIETVISVFEEVLKDDKSNPLRHRMEHLGLMTEDQIVRAGKINITLSFFVNHLYFYAETYSKDILGRERTDRWTPLRLATKHNVRWSIHQDHPAFPGSPQPFENIRTAVTRTRKGHDDEVYGPEYTVSVDEALKAYTINAAWQLNREEDLGSLEVGKKADLLILSDNPRTVDSLKLQDIKVVDTYINGRSNNLNQ